MRAKEQNTRIHAKSMRSNMTRAEAIMWNKLRELKIDGIMFRRQHSIGFYIADFACVKLKLVIEIDGATHSSESEIASDKKRDEYMKSKGWEIIRVWNSDIYTNLIGVMAFIETRVNELNMAQSLGVFPPPSALRAATSSVNGERIGALYPPPFTEEVARRSRDGGGFSNDRG